MLDRPAGTRNVTFNGMVAAICTLVVTKVSDTLTAARAPACSR